ncbi:MAG: Na/Pi cotransporter family protein [Saprospiraceae bacterium]|nr:Na/Pi cotransporter family protein [Saprospiraceae bacterium]
MLTAFFKLLVGVVIFLFGFNFIEESISNISGRSFKLYLKKQTSNPIKAIIGGTVVTAILQSSSIVNFLVLSFVGAGILKISNALAIVLRANLSTTLDSWVIATLGFQMNLENLSFPLIAIGGLLMFMSDKVGKIYYWSRFCVGLGFLFFGLEFIKNGVSEYLTTYDLSALAHYPLVVFVIFGLIATTLTQSSSVTIAITLATLYAHGISLIAAMAVVLGSEVGTTLKIILASLNGPSVKKKVAYGNLIFNGFTLLLAYIFIKPTYHLIKDIIAIKDPLLALVFFQTMINLLTILLFLPFLKKLGYWLDKHVSSTMDKTNLLQKISVNEGDFAHDALEKETKTFLNIVLLFSNKVFEKNTTLDLDDQPLQKKISTLDNSELYHFIKHKHGEIRNYAFNLHRLTNDEDKLKRLDQLLEAIREAMYAVKSIKDSFIDIEALRNSSNDVKYGSYVESKTEIPTLVANLMSILRQDTRTYDSTSLAKLLQKLDSEFVTQVGQYYKTEFKPKLIEDEFSTLINFDREIFNASRSMILMTEIFLSNVHIPKHQKNIQAIDGNA